VNRVKEPNERNLKIISSAWFQVDKTPPLITDIDMASGFDVL
jgi:hypothetical protein